MADAPEDGGPLQRAARAALWPPKRFFDPRFEGVDSHVVSAHQDLADRLQILLEHVNAARAEAASSAARTDDALRRMLDAQMRAQSVATTLIGRALAEQRAALERIAGPVEPIDGEGGETGTAHRVEAAYAFRALAGVARDARVLDVGAPDRAVAASLAALGYRLTVAGSDGPPEDEAFDAVVCLATTAHAAAAGPDADVRTLADLRRRLAPGGLLVLSTPYMGDRAALSALLTGLEIEDLTIVRHHETGVWAVGEDAGEGEAVALVTARRSAA